MKSSVQRLTASALLCVLLGAALASCGETASDPIENPEGGENTAAVTEAVTEETLTAREQVSDNLPEKDYGGKAYRIIQRTGFEYEFDAPQLDGETINDAIYNRNLTVCERYNINLKTEAFEALWNSGKFNKIISDFVLAGDDAYDIVAGYMCDITPTISQGLYLNWHEIPNVDLTKPWWSTHMIDTFTINDRIYMISGDLALSFWRQMYALCYNKAIAAANDIEGLYQTVLDGKWTFGYMEELCQSVSADVNGDGKMDKNDLYGFSSNYATAIDSFKEAFDIPVITKDEKGIPQFTVVTDRVTAVLEGLANFYKTNAGFFDADAAISETMFRDNRALFYSTTFTSIEALRDLETDFGLLPYPKWDDAQKEYGSVVCDGATVFLVPLTVPDTEFVGIITEAMAAESYKHVVPDYYDIVLKTKTSRDADSEAMIDLIRDTIHIDFGYIHSTALNGVGHLFVNQVRNKSANIASAFKSAEKKATQQLEDILAFYYSDN